MSKNDPGCHTESLIYSNDLTEPLRVDQFLASLASLLQYRSSLFTLDLPSYQIYATKVIRQAT
jgi:hypothetical protein